MKQDPNDVLKQLKQKQYSPVYFLQGDEPYYIDLIARHIEEKVLNDTERSFNQMVLYGKDVDVSTVLTQAKRYPMMAERQVVIVKEAQDITDFNTSVGQQLLEAYVRNPMPSTLLVLCYKYKKVDSRKTLGKALDKLAVWVESKKLYDNQLPTWIAGLPTAAGFSHRRQGGADAGRRHRQRSGATHQRDREGADQLPHRAGGRGD